MGRESWIKACHAHSSIVDLLVLGAGASQSYTTPNKVLLGEVA
jgi:hypothetical protein